MATKSIADHIRDMEFTRSDLAKQMEAIAQKAAEENRHMSEEEISEFDELESQIKTLDADIERQKRIEALAKGAKPVDSVAKEKAERKDVQVRAPVAVKNTEKLEPGIAFARAAKCLALGHLEHRDAISIAKSVYSDREDIVAATASLVTKAAVAPATTTDQT